MESATRSAVNLLPRKILLECDINLRKDSNRFVGYTREISYSTAEQQLLQN